MPATQHTAAPRPPAAMCSPAFWSQRIGRYRLALVGGLLALAFWMAVGVSVWVCNDRCSAGSTPLAVQLVGGAGTGFHPQHYRSLAKEPLERPIPPRDGE